jgi:hypothetical protein
VGNLHPFWDGPVYVLPDDPCANEHAEFASVEQADAVVALAVRPADLVARDSEDAAVLCVDLPSASLIRARAAWYLDLEMRG